MDNCYQTGVRAKATHMLSCIGVLMQGSQKYQNRQRKCLSQLRDTKRNADRTALSLKNEPDPVKKNAQIR